MTTARPWPPVALSIAGSDPSGGAGIQADLKTFSALGAYGGAVLTALTAQNTQGVTGIHVVPAEFVTAQLETFAADVRLDAIKIGMLANARIARAVGDFLRTYATTEGDPYVVLDPVMVATSGDRLLDEDAIQAVGHLLPLADIVTPNLAEAAVLLRTAPPRDLAQMHDQAQALLSAGARRVLLKGGHCSDVPGGQPTVGAPAAAIDVYADAEGTQEMSAERVATVNTHGTGCTLSSAMAALRPQRLDWPTTVRDAKAWLTDALQAADTLRIGHGHGPVHHFHEYWSTR